MFFDVVDMTTTYIQYLTLLLKLSPESLPSFYMGPAEFIRYALLDTSQNIDEVQRYENPLRVDLPEWLPLDIRLQYVCVAIIGPLALSTIGLLLVHGKPAYAWLVCLLSTLFMFLFALLSLENTAAPSAPASVLPSKSTLGILSGVGLPLFVLLLVVGLLCMGRARLRRLRSNAAELERLIDEERQRQESQRITHQVVDRQGIGLVDVAAERVHATRREYFVAHLDVEDVLWQGVLVLVLLIGTLVLLGGIPIRAIHEMQHSIVFRVLGSIFAVLFAVATLYWSMTMFAKGRRYLYACSAEFNLHALNLIMMVASLLYISVVTNFIAIIYCTPQTCEAGSKLSHPASLLPRMSYTTGGNSAVAPLDGSPVGCLPCSFHNFTQKCPTAFQQSLCAEPQQQSRLVYDLRVACDGMDDFYIASGTLMFMFYILFLPYLQFYIAQYGVRVLQDVYPLERRYHDVFTSEELYFQKVLSSDNSAAFAYRAYKPQFRFYRLSFLLQKIILGVVGCVMQRGQQHQTAWVGMLFFMAVPLIALSCAVYLRPFSRPTETIYFPTLQAMVAVCSAVFLVSWQFGTAAVPLSVWIFLPIALIGVPVIALVLGTALSLREERRWKNLLEKRLLQGVTAAHVMPDGRRQQVQSSSPRQRGSRDGALDGSEEAAACNSEGGAYYKGWRQQPSQQAGDSKKLEKDSGDKEMQRCDLDGSSRSLLSSNNRPLASAAAAAGISTSQGACVVVLPRPSHLQSDPLSSPSAFTPLNITAPTAHHGRPAAERRLSPFLSSSSSAKDVQRPLPSRTCDSTSRRRAAPSSKRVVVAPAHLNTAAITESTRASFKSAHGTNTRYVVPALLQTRTCWGTLRMFGLIALETVAAPFLLFSDPGRWHNNGVGRDKKRSDGMAGIADRDSDASTSAAVEPGTEPRRHKPHRSTVAEAAFSFMSLAPLFQSARRIAPASPAAVNARGHGSHTYATQLVGCVPDEKPPQPRRASRQLPQQCTSAVRANASRDTAPSPWNCLPAFTPPAAARAVSPLLRHHRLSPCKNACSSNEAPALSASGLQRRRVCSSLSGSPFGSGLLRRSPEESLRNLGSGAGALRPPKLTGAGASDPNLHLSSSHVCVPSTLKQPDEAPLPPFQHQQSSPRSVSRNSGNSSLCESSSLSQHQQPVMSRESSRRRRSSFGTAAAADAAAGEYAREATAEFVPSLYFLQYAPATWWFAKMLPRLPLNSRRRSRISSSDAVAAGIHYSAGVARRLSTSLGLLLAGAPLPWQKTPLAEETPEKDSSLPQAFLSPRLSLSDAAAAAAVTLPRQRGGALLGDEANHTDDGACPSSCIAVLKRLQRALRKMVCCLSCGWMSGARVADSGTGRSGGLGAVLSFTEVYVRRQACARSATKSGLECLCTERELQRQRLETARKAFWGNTTDAMLGVVDVAGSMPPWSLFCNVRLPPVAPAASQAAAQQQPLQQTMLSLQRQYYAQLASQQCDADTKSFGGALNGRSASTGAHEGDSATAVRYCKRGNVAKFNSPLTCMSCTSCSLEGDLGVRLPENPLRAAARERQAAAVFHRQECSKGMVPLPLDTEMCTLGAGGRCGRCKGVSGEVRIKDEHDHGRRSGVSMDLDVSLEMSETGCGPKVGLAGTLHWLAHWGPMLTELLYEAAAEDGKGVTAKSRTMCRDARASSSSSDSSTNTYAQSMPGLLGTEQQQRRRSRRGSKGWRTRLLPKNWGWASKSPRRRGGGEFSPQQRLEGQSIDRDGRVSLRNRDRHMPPSFNSPSVISRQPSRLLSLITGGVSRTSSVSRISEPFTVKSATPLQHTAVAKMISRHSRSFSSPLSASAVNSAFPGEGAARLCKQHQTAPRNSNNDCSNKKAPVMVASRASTSRHRSSRSQRVRSSLEPDLEHSPSTPSQRHSAAAADPLIQQLRCLHLLRERLKTSYWEHLKQLTAVQHYIDYEINEAVGRVLSFLFIVLGIVSTIALALVLCGMLRTVDWTFISGVHRAKGTLLYELAGYDSWDNFTQYCCCMAVTDAAASYPYYALDVESWVCANGVTKERVRRDGYDNAITDGYSVRGLCGMEFKHNCAVAVLEGKVVLTGCDSHVSSEAAQRW
ncbi:hypothetical protein LSCM4_06639 [Leishmania orientalis]|uniref:Uncharacterized protein n=1 Tax=Leishmania orientalis TaxID=2249476 RepID=A0A836HWQ0_9TRYP|nr:hypothetical protein LSCM4_06639 [Leishmania orientalis]